MNHNIKNIRCRTLGVLCTTIFGQKRSTVALLILICSLVNSCKKFVEVNTLKDQLLSSQVFDNATSANAAIDGIYTDAKNSLMNVSIYNGLASDELVYYSPTTETRYYQNNTIPSTDGVLPWSALYATIYSANAAIEGLSAGNSVVQSTKDYYIGEAKFLRAYSYFYLVNLFGDVPLITSTDVNAAAMASRSPSADVFNQIISDLTDAQGKLGSNYSFTGGDRTRADKWVATALLARVYLYKKDWPNAEAQATLVINSGQYSLLSGPAGIFVKNNDEAILQWARYSGEVNSIPGDFIFTSSPKFICSSFLTNAFEPGDQRKTVWVASATYASTTVYYPFKFTNILTTTNENYTVLRLAEQYLIRAEARAMQNRISDAVTDINLIRQDHGALPGIANNISQQDCLTEIMHERQVEFFTEEMHRWLDLKRTGKIDSVMNAEKPGVWKSSDALYPIPLADLQRDPKLTQNPGY